MNKVNSPSLALVETPCIVVDVSRMEQNIRLMAEKAKQTNVNLRPHAKTHKMPRIAKKQIEAGAIGVTAAKVSEAEVLADGGISNIFIAYPLIAETKIERAIKLSQRIELIVGVDSLEGVRRLSELAELHGHTLQVRLEVDTGLKRTGVPFDQAVRLAREIHRLAFIRFEALCNMGSLRLIWRPQGWKKAA